MSIKRVSFIFLAAALLCAASYTPTCAAVLYQETFGRPGPPAATGNLSPVEWDWVRFNAPGTANTGNGINGTDNGAPIGLVNTLSAGAHIDGTFLPYDRGWLFMDGSATAGQKLAMTTEFSFDPANHPLGVNFSWWQGNANPNASPTLNQMKLAVRVGGSWYASVEDFSNTHVASGGAFAAGAELKTLTYDPSAENWLTLIFDGDYDPATNTATGSTLGALALGAVAAADLSGPITAFGLYRNEAGSNARIDTFRIAEVPEPGSIALVALALFGVAAARRRR